MPDNTVILFMTESSDFNASVDRFFVEEAESAAIEKDKRNLYDELDAAGVPRVVDQDIKITVQNFNNFVAALVAEGEVDYHEASQEASRLVGKELEAFTIIFKARMTKAAKPDAEWEAVEKKKIQAWLLVRQLPMEWINAVDLMFEGNLLDLSQSEDLAMYGEESLKLLDTATDDLL